MASNHTQHYGLCQWEATDGVLRVDFNEDNQKIDTALKELEAQDKTLAEALASQAETIQSCGNCRVVYGSYIGTDKYGVTNPNTLTFSHKPLVVFVQSEEVQRDQDIKLRLMRGISWAVGMEGNYTWQNFVSWQEKSVQWYSSKSAHTQFNLSTATYHYVALLAADE